MQPQALLLTDGLLTTSDAKTAHGLIRGTERYRVRGVIDPPTAGQDAGEVLDGTNRDMPVWATVEEALTNVPEVTHAIIAVATSGGVLPAHMMASIRTCLSRGLSVVNGLHEFLSDKPELVRLAEAHGGELIDIRKPKPRNELHFWTGAIYTVQAPVVAVMGTDCALGKRTTARLLTQACQDAGMSAEMIYTGQTGWLQGGRYGFIFDTTVNDFVSGELEHAIVSCWNETGADLLFVEGQASLRNPGGPCGAEFLVSGNARAVVLVHAPKRTYYDHVPAWGEIPSVESEIALIRAYGAEVIALALNTEACTLDEALTFQDQYRKTLQLPVLLPLEQGVADLIPVLKAFVDQKKQRHAHP
ncbi:DUF1611 domain-containing protein [Arsenicibacter rosenii]|uniref:EBNA-1 nuclear protein n=1 Tax=Arsenicibacter rosenii TaxID=1750698 RepID=A0A1S2VQ86_9BACT|nr:DUF1611 domain-containing protein [Arsenicibacter rosenii]OIN60943.1 hypothetical protein BLX24_02335 [Arsenicibacter rosenii]